MKKKLLKGLSICLCAAFLAGCGSDFSESDQKFAKLSDKAGLDGTVITMMASADWISDAEMKLGTNFEAATGIQVVYDLYTDEVYLDTLFERLNGDDPPDLFMTQSGLAIRNTYHLDRYSADLSEEPWMENYDVFSMEETSIDGRNYGMSYFDNTIDYYIIYNRKLAQKAGVGEAPETFEAFEEMCAKLTGIGVTPMYEPMADGWHQTMFFAECGQVFEKRDPGMVERLNRNEMKFADSEDMRLALEQIRSLAQKGYMGKTYQTDTYDNAIGYLANGEYAMCMLRPGMIESILDSDMNNGYTKEDFGIMLFPVCDNQILNVHPTGPSKFICNASRNIEAAKLYLQYIASKESVQYVIDNENGVNNLPFHLGQTSKHDETTKNFIEGFDDEHSGMVLQDVVTYFNEQWGDVSADILEMCEGDITPQDVLERIDERRATLAGAAGDPAWP